MKNKEICQSVRSMADAYIDGELDAKEKATLEAHLSECGECRSFFDERRRIANAVRVSAEDLPPSLHQRIIDSARTERTKAKRSRRVRKTALLGAIALIATVATIFMATMPIWLIDEEPMDGNADTSAVIDDEYNANDIPTASTPPTNAEVGTPENAPSSDAVGDGEAESNVPEDDGVADDAPTLPTDTNAPTADDVAPGTTPPTDKPAEGESTNKIPDGNDITLAVLALSGLLAVASFIAFLISLSSVRKYQIKNDDESDSK